MTEIFPESRRDDARPEQRPRRDGPHPTCSTTPAAGVDGRANGLHRRRHLLGPPPTQGERHRNQLNDPPPGLERVVSTSLPLIVTLPKGVRVSRKGGPPMPEFTPFETRCRHGVACDEVRLRVVRAHEMIYVEGCRDHGEELLAIAERIAAVHGHGQTGSKSGRREPRRHRTHSRQDAAPSSSCRVSIPTSSRLPARQVRRVLCGMGRRGRHALPVV